MKRRVIGYNRLRLMIGLSGSGRNPGWRPPLDFVQTRPDSSVVGPWSIVGSAEKDGLNESQKILNWAGGQLEALSPMTAAQSRGTIRIALKKAGLDPSSFTPSQLEVVLEKIMPKELRVRGIRESGSICQSLIQALRTNFDPSKPSADPTDSVIHRIFG